MNKERVEQAQTERSHRAAEAIGLLRALVICDGIKSDALRKSAEDAIAGYDEAVKKIDEELHNWITAGKSA